MEAGLPLIGKETYPFLCKDFSGKHNREKSPPFCIKDKDFLSMGHEIRMQDASI
jgi:hypothetical protein